MSWLVDFAQTRGLEHKQDSVGNLVIKRPGSGGGEGAQPVAIQGHVDMVCEKNNDVTHDFYKDPIRLVREGDWLKADGTTLGADNGIGVATALALLDAPKTTRLPPIEALFTVDEETGLTGAFGIGADLLTARTMLNLDTEDWGEVFIGCAGGGDAKLWLDIGLGPAPAGAAAYELKLGGLLGGHSGLNIHEGRGNAVQLLARTLRSLTAAVPGARVAALSGGDKRNAIAREARATLLLAPGDVAAAQQVVAARLSEYVAEYGTLEKDMFMRLEASPAPAPATVIEPSGLSRLLALVCTLPHGPLKFSHAVAGLVETSNNVASIHPQPASSPSSSPSSPAKYLVVTSTRSSLSPALEAVRDTIAQAAELAGAAMERGKAYPGWAPNPASRVLQITQACYSELSGGQQAKVGAIHAGLECGILGEKYPGMDTVSFGPTIKGAHSPDERVQISTVEPFWKLTLAVLDKLARA